MIGHEKFESIRNVPVVLYPATNQMAGKPAYQTTIGEAVDGFDRVRNKINDEEYTSIGFLTKPNEISWCALNLISITFESAEKINQRYSDNIPHIN